MKDVASGRWRVAWRLLEREVVAVLRFSGLEVADKEEVL
jgi:hypothetical protein